MVFNHIRYSAVSNCEDAASIASRGIGEGTWHTKLLQISNLLLNDINPPTDVSWPAFENHLGVHWLLCWLLLLGHAISDRAVSVTDLHINFSISNPTLPQQHQQQTLGAFLQAPQPHPINYMLPWGLDRRFNHIGVLHTQTKKATPSKRVWLA